MKKGGGAKGGRVVMSWKDAHDVGELKEETPKAKPAQQQQKQRSSKAQSPRTVESVSAQSSEPSNVKSEKKNKKKKKKAKNEGQPLEDRNLSHVDALLDELYLESMSADAMFETPEEAIQSSKKKKKSKKKKGKNVNASADDDDVRVVDVQEEALLDSDESDDSFDDVERLVELDARIEMYLKQTLQGYAGEKFSKKDKKKALKAKQKASLAKAKLGDDNTSGSSQKRRNSTPGGKDTRSSAVIATVKHPESNKQKKSNAANQDGVAKHDKHEKKKEEKASGREKRSSTAETQETGKKKPDQRHQLEESSYDEYLSHENVMRGLEDGSLLQGKLRVNSKYRADGYITVDGITMDILIKGDRDRNRAMDSDLVVVKLNAISDWKQLEDSKMSAKDDAQPAVVPSSSSGIDTQALHSLWRPSVKAEACFLPQANQDAGLDDVLKATRVAINENITKSKARPTGKIVYILASRNSHGFVGSLEPKTKSKDLAAQLSDEDAYAYFNAHDLRLPRRIRIPRLQLPDEFIAHPVDYSQQMLCFCRIKSWSTKHRSPMGEFVKTVGEFTGIESGISAILAKNGLQPHTLDFSSEILDDLDVKYGINGEKWLIPEEEQVKRKDFRQVQIFSIDPYNARDLDDALHIRPLNDARTIFEVGVHIADVTHFIEKDSLLDMEARQRATSVYLANRVLPMLPRILCEKLCSLQPQVDRLAFSVVWQMNADGSLVDGCEPWFGKSIIRSCCKLDYGSAQKMLDGAITSDLLDEWETDRRPTGENPQITNASVIQSVKDLWQVAKHRRATRFETGAISLNDVKLVFSLDAKGNPTRFGGYELKDSNRLVEEYMLLANYLVAQHLLRSLGPLAFLRNHSAPIARALDTTLGVLSDNNFHLDGSSTKALSDSLEEARLTHGELKFSVIQAMIIKPMTPAQYIVAGNGADEEAWRHYALNIPYYTHFTSPIRRYADVVVHRLLQQSVTMEAPFDRSAPDVPALMHEFAGVAQNCNDKKMAAKNAETECDQVFLCAYVKHYSAVEVTGVVMSMGQQSFTVYIMEIGSEQRMFLKENNLKGVWNEKQSSLSIVLNADGKGTKKKTSDAAQAIQLSFMKQLRFRMSSTDTMPLKLSFTLLGEKEDA